MKETANLLGRPVEYTITRSFRSRRINLYITEEGEVKISYPARYNSRIAHAFMQKKAPWILRKVEEMKQSDREVITLARDAVNDLRKKSRELVENRLAYFNQFYGYSWKRIVIKNQKTRWGSCSRKGNLNFCYKIAALPAELADYIVVHELCHLGEFNHSNKFWELVARMVPDWKEKREQLRNIKIVFK